MEELMLSELEMYRALPEAERERMGFERYREETRRGTHCAQCWAWGPGHYGCAIREIERLQGCIELREQVIKNDVVLRTLSNAIDTER